MKLCFSLNNTDLPLLPPILQKTWTGAGGWCRLQGTVTLLQHQIPVPNTRLLLCCVLAAKPWHWYVPSSGDFWAELSLICLSLLTEDMDGNT